MSLVGNERLLGDSGCRMKCPGLLLLLILIFAGRSSTLGASADAPVTAAKMDIRSGIKSALVMFADDCGRYPTTSEGTAALVDRPRDIATNRWHGPYLDRIPLDPWGQEYGYLCPAKHSTNEYEIYSRGRDGISKSDGADPDDINSWDETSPQDLDAYLSLFERVSRSPALLTIVMLFLGFLSVTTLAGMAWFGMATFSSKVRDSIGKRPLIYFIWLIVTLFGLWLLLYILVVP
jgi:general secretion pathway protein G